MTQPTHPTDPVEDDFMAKGQPERVGGESKRGWLAAYVVLAIATPLVYVALTGHVWEDYLITFRHSKNLAEGNGLVYQLGERVHGFTSPLGVLLPALFQWMTRSDDILPALNLFRAASLAAFVAAGWILLRLLLSIEGKDRFVPPLFILLYVTEAKSVAFAMNGQETAFMLFFLALGFQSIYHGIAKNWVVCAIAWAGLMWTRPDGCIYCAALLALGLLFPAEDRKTAIRAAVKAFALAALLYLPWIVFTTWYYGSPIPHTVTAKYLPNSPTLADPANLASAVLSKYPPTMMSCFQPIYFNLGGWRPEPVFNAYGFAMGAVASLAWLAPGVSRLGRLASLVFLLGCLYLSYVGRATVNVFPWYQPPVAMCGLVAIALAIRDLVSALTTSHAATRYATRLIQVTLIGVSLYLFIGFTAQIRVQQSEVENGHRRAIGEFLHSAISKPGETVMLEPLGYIGYYSNARMLDVPGLVAPSVVAAKKSGVNSYSGMIKSLKPDWLVLRPGEISGISSDPEIRRYYQLARTFDATQKIREHAWVPGINYPMFDAVFIVLHRVEPPAPPAPDAAR